MKTVCQAAKERLIAIGLLIIGAASGRDTTLIKFLRSFFCEILLFTIIYREPKFSDGAKNDPVPINIMIVNYIITQSFLLQ